MNKNLKAKKKVPIKMDTNKHRALNNTQSTRDNSKVSVAH